MEKVYFEIALDKDRRDVAAAFVANGYSVCLEVVANGKGRGKEMLAVWKDKKRRGEERAMRDYLFRGKRKDNGEYIEGLPYYGLSAGLTPYVAIIPFIDVNGMKVSDHWRVKDVDEETIGQFTGMTDKNGTPPHEGRKGCRAVGRYSNGSCGRTDES